MTDYKYRRKSKACPGNFKRLLVQWFLSGLVLLQIAPQISHAEPTPFRAIYTAEYAGIPVFVEGIRELTKLNDKEYILTNSVDSWLGSITEKSNFTWHAGDQLIPQEYRYRRRGMGRKRDAILKFDWSKHQVLNDVQSKPWKMTIPDGSMDKLGYQVKMRADLQQHYSQSTEKPNLSYLIADGGRVKTYNFELLGEEDIDTPVGRLSTIKVARLRKNDKRSTIFWLAKDWQFLLVRLEQTDSGNSSLNLFLKKATVNGTVVKGT
jgi:hypothetical protein